MAAAWLHNPVCGGRVQLKEINDKLDEAKLVGH